MLGTDLYKRPIHFTQGVHASFFGMTGMGKSTLMERCIDFSKPFAAILQDGSAERYLAQIPPHLTNKVIYMSPVGDYIVPIPTLDDPDYELAVSDFVSFLKNLNITSWGQRLEWGLSSMLRAVRIADIVPPLSGLHHALESASFRDYIGNPADPFGKSFFAFLKDLPATTRKDTLLPVIHRINALMQNPHTRRMLAYPATFSIAEAMDRGQTIILDIPVGKVSEETARILGAALVNAFVRAAPRRKNINAYPVFMDEVQTYTSGINLGSALATVRKYGLFFGMATTNLEQFDDQTLAAMLANSGVLASFRTSARDAKRLANELGTDMQPRVLQELAKYECLYARRGENLPIRPEIVRILPPKAINPYRAERIKRARRWGREPRQIEALIRRGLK
jgi:hypothetical protein